MPDRSIVCMVSTPDVKGQLPSIRGVWPVRRPEIRCTSIAFPLSTHLLVGDMAQAPGGVKGLELRRKKGDKALIEQKGLD